MMTVGEPITLTSSGKDEVETILLKTRELLANESHWTQGTLARTKSGGTSSPSSDYAASWCLSGALRRASNGYSFSDEYKARIAVAIQLSRFPWTRRLLLRLNPDKVNQNIEEFNDASDRFHAEVLDLIDEAIISRA